MNYQIIYQEGEYLHTHPSWHIEDAIWKSSAISKIIKKHELSITSVADVGCGAGGILSTLQQSLDKDIKYFGYDISPIAIGLCKQWENENLVFRNENLLEIEVNNFDLILCIDVFEHVEDYLDFLRKLKSKGKYKLFHIPLDLSVQTLLRPSVISRRRTISGHLHYFTKDTSLMILRDCGYNIVDYLYTSSNRSWVLTHTRNLSYFSKIRSVFISFFRNILFSINPDFAVRLLGGYSLLVLTT